jgi:CheY-like chemotaxis protein
MDKIITGHDMYSKALKTVAFDLTVLYVEDDRVISESFGHYLSRFFKKVVIVQSGAEALDAYKQERFDLVITDVDMPVMSGLQLIEEIHKIEAFQVVMVSSSTSDTKLLIELLNTRIFGFITKPIELDVAARYLYTVCDRIHDKKMLMHYVSELEAMQNFIAAKGIEPVMPKESPKASEQVEEDDFFEFFSAPAQTTQNHESDIIYSDYFAQLQEDDKEELKDLLSDIDASLMAAFTQRGGNNLYVTKLGNSLVRYGNILMHYQFFSDMGGVILQLGQAVVEHTEHIVANSKEMQLYIGGFCSVIQNFLHEVWEVEAENPKFFNDSIVNDATTIISLVVPVKVAEDNNELVFF